MPNITVDATAEEKLFLLIWHERSGFSFEQICQCLLLSGLFEDGAMTWDEVVKSLPDAEKIAAAKPDWSDLPEDRILDPEVEKLINETLREANED